MGLYFSKGVFAGLIFGGAYFRKGLLLEGILFQNWFGLTNIKAAQNTKKRAYYIGRIFASEIFFGGGEGLIFMRAYFVFLLLFFLWWGRYYRNF